MTDRILSRCLWLVIMGLIAASALGGLVLMYSGLFKLITQQFDVGTMIALSGVALGLGCWFLCKHSDDLIDREFLEVAQRPARYMRISKPRRDSSRKAARTFPTQATAPANPLEIHEILERRDEPGVWRMRPRNQG